MVTKTVPVLLMGGVPLSVTLMSKVLVEGPPASKGVQLRTPLVGFKVNPLVGVSNVHVMFCGGFSMSVTTLVKLRVLVSVMVRLLVGETNAGGVLLKTVRTTSLPSPPT